MTKLSNKSYKFSESHKFYNYYYKHLKYTTKITSLEKYVDINFYNQYINKTIIKILSKKIYKLEDKMNEILLIKNRKQLLKEYLKLKKPTKNKKICSENTENTEKMLKRRKNNFFYKLVFKKCKNIFTKYEYWGNSIDLRPIYNNLKEYYIYKDVNHNTSFEDDFITYDRFLKNIKNKKKVSTNPLLQFFVIKKVEEYFIEYYKKVEILKISTKLFEEININYTKKIRKQKLKCLVCEKSYFNYQKDHICEKFTLKTPQIKILKCLYPYLEIEKGYIMVKNEKTNKLFHSYSFLINKFRKEFKFALKQKEITYKQFELKRRKKVKRQEYYKNKIVKNFINCELCKLNFNDSVKYESHFKEENHITNLKGFLLEEDCIKVFNNVQDMGNKHFIRKVILKYKKKVKISD